MEERRARLYLRQGIAAVKAGEHEEARRLLRKVAAGQVSHRLTVQAWLWLSATSSDPDDRRDCLLHALAVDPSDPVARRGLALLEGKIQSPSWLRRGLGDEVEGFWAPPRQESPEGAEPQWGETQHYECSRCGGHVAYSPEQGALVCKFCGRVQLVAAEGKEATEEDFALALPTRPAHGGRVPARVLACSECGATTIMPSDALTADCPFCGTPYVVAVEEIREVITPNGVIPFRLSLGEARDHLWEWLGQGWVRPDDLVQQARQEALRGVYLPFWLFDGTGTALYRGASDPEGDGFLPYHNLFDDVTVPAGGALPQDLTARLRYNTAATAAYAPGYVIGWPAELAEVNLADASLEAREQMAQATRTEAQEVLDSLGSHSPEPNVRVTLDTYRLVLFPVWITSYLYRGRRYPVVINGQDGTVVGKAPVDWVKVALWAAMGVLLAILAGLLAYAATTMFRGG